MKRISLMGLFFLVLLVCVGSASLLAKSNDSTFSSYVLQGRARVVISVESGWQRDGIIPVIVDVAGVRVFLWQDGRDGRVFAERHLLAPKGERGVSGRELFFLDSQLGQVRSGTVQLSGQVYEQNRLRTRIRMDDTAVVLELSADCCQAVLDLGGLKIPMQALLKKSDAGADELCLGDRPALGLERLLLDPAGQMIYREEIMRLPSDRQAPPARTCWAQKTSE